MRNDLTLTPNKIQQHELLKRLLTPATEVAMPNTNGIAEILVITSYPPRQCGIANYSYDLISSLNNKFSNSFAVKVCALETETEKFEYPDEVIYTLDTSATEAYLKLAAAINRNKRIEIILIQHEFGLFGKHQKEFQHFIDALIKPVSVVFHTVLPHPDEALKLKVQHIATSCESIVVMTNHAEQILVNDYNIPEKKVSIIPHGTHLVQHLDKDELKEKYNLSKRKILSTFGLLSSGKNIETTLQALPGIVKKNPDVLFLIIGKTHPAVIKEQGEVYRNTLESSVKALGLQNHVQFINRYLPLPDLLAYLQLTDIYLFTSKDPNQAVSGTFSYAMSCGCAIISTPIPHAKEVLGNDAGIIIDFEQPNQLCEAVNRLLEDEPLRKSMSLNGLHKIVTTAWENVAIAHEVLFEKLSANAINLNYSSPLINLDHLKKLTTDFGIIQFSKINQPDVSSGYTLDDNARAMIAMCQHYELTGNLEDINYIKIYLNFIKHCLQTEGYFLNYVSLKKNFTSKNNATNLADSNGRAFWALGYLISKSELFPPDLVQEAEVIMQQALFRINSMHSTRAMAFTIKGLYYYNSKKSAPKYTSLIKTLANRLVQMYKHECDGRWQWFESYLTYGNSILPEALLYAYLETGDIIYKNISKITFDFLLSKTFSETAIKVISNKSWMRKGEKAERYGEQPIDVAYTIFALSKFYDVFKEEEYSHKMEIAFNWFLGNNHLNQIIYNPCTGGCYDGLEENHVNLNQGAESTVSYLMARLVMEQQLNQKKNVLQITKEFVPQNQFA